MGGKAKPLKIKRSVPFQVAILNLVHLSLLPAIFVSLAQLIPISNEYVFTLVFLTAFYELPALSGFLFMHLANYPSSVLGAWARPPIPLMVMTTCIGFVICAVLVFIVSSYAWSVGCFVFFIVCLMSTSPEHTLFFFNQYFARNGKAVFTSVLPTPEQLSLVKISDVIQFWVVFCTGGLAASFYLMAGYTDLFSQKSSISGVFYCYIAFSLGFAMIQYYMSFVAKKADFHMGRLYQQAEILKISSTLENSGNNFTLENFEKNELTNSSSVILIKESTNTSSIDPNNFKFYTTITDILMWTRYQMIFRTVFFLQGELSWTRFITLQALETASQIILYPCKMTNIFVKFQRKFLSRYFPSVPLQDDFHFKKSVGVSMVTRQVAQLTSLIAFTLAVTLMRYGTDKKDFYPFLASIIDPSIDTEYFSVLKFAGVSFLVETIRSFVLTLLIKRMVGFNPFMNFQKRIRSSAVRMIAFLFSIRTIFDVFTFLFSSSPKPPSYL